MSAISSHKLRSQRRKRPDAARREADVDACKLLDHSRSAGKSWQSETLEKRLKHLRLLRHALVEAASAYAETSSRSNADVISSELLPLAGACKFLEDKAGTILRTRTVGKRGRATWLRGVFSKVERVPLGAVLIVAPSNYPLLLPGVQMLQALAAGNSVVIKPGQGGTDAARCLKGWADSAGAPTGLVQVLDETPEAGKAAVAAGFDKICFTGSAETGKAVLSSAAETLTQTTVELSGCDAVFILESADLDRAARAIAFGLTLNSGQTCIAPRRIFVLEGLKTEFVAKLAPLLAKADPIKLDSSSESKAASLLAGATPLVGGFQDDGSFAPALVDSPAEGHSLTEIDIFAPIASVLPYDSLDRAVETANSCPYALGASVFGDCDDAESVADRLDVGVVTINDLIVPTADPRLPFGGRGESGFGVTRGAEGLLEMTRPKVISARRGKWLPHLDTPTETDADILSGLLEFSYSSGFRARFRGLRKLISSARKGKRAKR